MMWRTLGATDVSVSQVGLGTWPLAGNRGLAGYGEMNEAAAEATVLEALATGITIFDTADVYGDGAAEDLLGRIVPDTGNVFIVTKGGMVPGSGEFDCDPDSLIRRAEASLKRLRRKRIDGYLLHNPPPYLLAISRTYRSLEHLWKSGMVRFLGVSVANANDAWLLLDRPEVDLIEIPFSIVNLTADFGLITELARRGKAVLAREVLANGFLSDRARAGGSFEPDDFRASMSAEVRNQIDEITKSWMPYKRSNEMWTDFALRFVLDRPEVAVAFVGARRPDQIPTLRRAGMVPGGTMSWGGSRHTYTGASQT